MDKMKVTTRDNIFNQLSPYPVRKNGFDLSYEYISDWDLGKLYPFPPWECYPNDTMRSQINWKMILETLKKPIYSDLSIKFKEFEAVYRMLWKHWRNFYTGGRKGTYTAKHPVVNINCKSNVKGSLFDYLGFPVAFDYYVKNGELYMKKTEQGALWGSNPIYVSAFPFIAYDFIYFWNFINSELQENLIYNIQDNISNYTNITNTPHTNLQTDENNRFTYKCDDFYTILGNDLVYHRLFPTKVDAPFIYSGTSYKLSFNSELGFSDRFSFTGTTNSSSTTYPCGIIGAINTSTVDSDGYILQSLSTGTFSSVDFVNLGFLYNVNYERDYFTSAHTNRQLGNAPSLPVDVITSFNIPNNSPVGLSDPVTNVVSTNAAFNSVLNSSLKNTVSSFFMNDLRLVGAIAQLQEGALMSPKTFEYDSYLKFFFGSGPNSKDMLQPNYIGGFNSSFYTSEVIQQSGSTTDLNNLGDYAGKGSSIDTGYIGNYTSTEIGLRMLVMYIVPKVTLQSSQGINRQWLRTDRYDYYNPAFAHLGFQEIQKQELFVANNSLNKVPFGYTMAYNELRYMPDCVTGNMRDLLDIWHLARKYKNVPILNSDYLLCRPSKRIFDVQSPTTPVITGRVIINKVAYRDMPELAIPELLDHRY